MVVRYPLASADDVAAEFRPDGRTLTKSALRTLKERGAISKGVAEPLRDPAGHVRGTVRLYCALNLDAASAERRGDHGLAVKLAGEAKRIEGGREMANAVRVVCATLAKGQNPRRELRTGRGEAAALSKLGMKVVVARNRLLATTLAAEPLFGQVGSTDGLLAEVIVGGIKVPLSVSVTDLFEQDSLWVGAPVLLRWEHWGHGRTLLVTEPAMDLSLSGLDDEEPPLGRDPIYPYERPLQEAPVKLPATLSRARPTMARPRRIPIAD